MHDKISHSSRKINQENRNSENTNLAVIWTFQTVRLRTPGNTQDRRDGKRGESGSNYPRPWGIKHSGDSKAKSNFKRGYLLGQAHLNCRLVHQSGEGAQYAKATNTQNSAPLSNHLLYNHQNAT